MQLTEFANRPTYPADIPADLKDLLSRMLEKDENKRITMNEIKVLYISNGE